MYIILRGKTRFHHIQKYFQTFQRNINTCNSKIYEANTNKQNKKKKKKKEKKKKKLQR